MELNELQRLKRDHFRAICAISDTGGLSVADTADEALRLNSRLFDEIETLIIERDAARAASASVVMSIRRLEPLRGLVF